jgi:hypothetical protein
MDKLIITQIGNENVQKNLLKIKKFWLQHLYRKRWG